MKNLSIGINALTATANGNIADLLNVGNSLIVYQVNTDGYKSWKPNRLSAITQFVKGSAYLIIATQAVDVTSVFDEPAPAVGGATIYNKTAGDLIIDACKSNGDVINSNTLPSGQNAQFQSTALPPETNYVKVSGQGIAKFIDLVSYEVNNNSYTENDTFDLSTGFTVGVNYLQGGAVINLIFATA